MDASAPGADRLAVGKVMLATSFGTGRVLKLTRTGATVTVVLGPISITDVVRDADLGSSTPIPLGATLAYTTPSAPGAAVDAPTTPWARPPRPLDRVRPTRLRRVRLPTPAGPPLTRGGKPA